MVDGKLDILSDGLAWWTIWFFCGGECWWTQVGVTPEGVEVPICSVDKKMQEVMRKMPEDVRPVVPTGPDRKWRYMWRIGPRPQKTRFQV